jgi:hypothetical protein
MAANSKLGWATAGAIAWAYLGLAAALGPGVREGKPPLGFGLGHAPDTLVIPGKIRELTEKGGHIHLVIETPDGLPSRFVPPPDLRRGGQLKGGFGGEPGSDQDGRMDSVPRNAPADGPGGFSDMGLPAAAPGQHIALPDGVSVEFIPPRGDWERMPRIKVSSGEQPWKLPRGGYGIVAGPYFLRMTPHDVLIVPRARMKETLKRFVKQRRGDEAGPDARDGRKDKRPRGEGEPRRQPAGDGRAGDGPWGEGPPHDFGGE